VRLVEGLAGACIVFFLLLDVFLSVVVPRAVGRRFRLSAYLTVPVWFCWRSAALRFSDSEKREDFLATYAPLVLVGLLATWVAGLVLGYGLLLFAVREELRPIPGFGGALYFAGTSLLTIGYGDVVPAQAFARMVSVVAATSGLAVLALVTAFLFQIFAAFQQREVFVVTLGTRAGAPASGVTLLENYARLGIATDLDDLFEEGQRWSAQVLETHMAYPILSYFRSSHDYESWVSALGALLDATTLLLTTIDGTPAGHAELMNVMGRHAARDLGHYFRLESGSNIGVERAEFDAARDRLVASGYRVTEADAAWESFARLRSTYATVLDSMARYWRIPPAQWVGDRSLLPVHQVIPPPPRGQEASG
jgi:hypothetical protein